MTNKSNSDSREIIIPVWLAAQECQDLYNALNNFLIKPNKKLDINKLLKSSSVKQELITQGCNTEAEFAYLSALAKAGNDYHRIWAAPKGQQRR